MAKKEFNLQEAFAAMPEEPEGFREYCLRMMENIAIFYRRNGKISDCTCGKCGENFITDKIPVRSGSAICPVCGHKGHWEWKRITRMQWQEKTIALIQCTSDENIVIRIYDVYQHFQQYSVAVQRITERRRYFLTLGDAYKVPNGMVYTSNGWERQWGKTEFDGVCVQDIYPGWTGELKKSKLKYFDPKTMCKCTYLAHQTIEALIAFANNPAIEMYAKSGMKKLVDHLNSKEGKTKYINRRGKSLKAQLRIEDKERIRKLIEKQGDIRYLKIYQEERKHGVKYSDEQVEFMVKVNSYWKGTENVAYLLQYMTIQKLINRIEKYGKQENGYTSTGAVLCAYTDYLKMRIELGYDLENEVYVFPNNLKEKHDLMVTEKREREDSLHMAKMKEQYPEIAKRYKALCKKYCFEKDNMFVRPAKNAAEIVSEGRELHHCVGREMYLKRHAEGKSTILFLRKKETPDVPYYTIEISGNELVQWYGIKDTKPDEGMVRAWLNEFIANLSNEKKLKAAV